MGVGMAGLAAGVREAVAGSLGVGTAPGAVLAVSRGGETWVEAVGRASVGGAPMPDDAVMRISSMTKPLVAVLTLMLAEDGVLALADPVERWLPELADRQVVRRLDGPLTDTEPAGRSITVEDLLTMRMGFGFAFEVEGCPAAEAAAARGLGMGPPLPSAITHSPDEWLARFAELPLMDQPGRTWRYDVAFAVLGVLLARAGQASLPELMRTRVLAPLGMTSTGFVVPDDARLVPSYVSDGAGALVLFDPVEGSEWREPPVFPHAGGGMVSTAADYLQFGEFMLARGAGLLGEESIRAMTTDQLTPEQRAGGPAGIFLDGDGWGYGVSVNAKRYGWGGGLGTSWYAYPEHDLTAVLLTQMMPPSESVATAFWSTIEAEL
ncbi:beta-lactamase family protein [Kribbella sp. NBC_01245]|uniref:serine hydrolase domain-containing protein n=1 Tax=Kribbella sp. NBC_01245 TaxID=2903578 RepID=UPI002E2DC609|nr:serine hydrolase domain-containing protein [Kribbella sp. NBC_01245]